jgi:hypothetical protein
MSRGDVTWAIADITRTMIAPKTSHDAARTDLPDCLTADP